MIKQINIRIQLMMVVVISLIPWLMLFSIPAREDQIWFFNVGQGDSIYIQTREGNRILIDGGPDNTILSKLSSRIPWWDKRIDLVIATHYHEDHIAGLVQVLEHYQVKKVILPNSEFESPVKNMLLDVIIKRNIENIIFHPQDKIKTNGINLECVWGSDISTIDPNRSAYMFLVMLDNNKYLLTSDVELSSFDMSILTNEIGDVDVIKVPHQGNKNSLNQMVLDTIKPELAIISVGKNNYGHPSENMIDLLGQNNILVYRTDRDGDIMINTIDTIQKVSKYK